MMNQIETFLFARHFGNNDVPLFQKHIDVVRALLANRQSTFYTSANTESVEYKKKLNNLKVHLSKVLNKTIKPSKDFTSSMKEIIKSNLTNVDINIGEVLNEFEQILFGKSKIFVSKPTDTDTDELNRRYGNSKTQIVFVSRPVELYDNNRALDFIDAVLDSMISINLRVTEKEIDVEYEFYFAHFLVAYEFFDKLLKRTINRCKTIKKSNGLLFNLDDEKQIKEIFEQLNKQNIKVYCVDELFCSLPVAVFNHTSQDACGFVFFSIDATKFSIARMSDPALNRWYKNLYLRAKFLRKELVFEKYNGFTEKTINKVEEGPNDLLDKV